MLNRISRGRDLSMSRAGDIKEILYLEYFQPLDPSKGVRLVDVPVGGYLSGRLGIF